MHDSKKSVEIYSKRWFLVIIICVVAIIIYSNVYDVPFSFDDNHCIKNNVSIRKLSSFFSSHSLFRGRLLVDFTFALNYHFGKLNVFGYHVVNVLIHIANGVLAYFLALSILGCVFLPLMGKEVGNTSRNGAKKRDKTDINPLTTINDHSSVSLIAFFAALIFVAHPLQTQAVTYIVQRYTSMVAFFYMASVLSYIKARNVSRGILDEEKTIFTVNFQPVGYFLLSVVCGLLAFKSKENAASLPGAIVLVEFICFGGTWNVWKKRLLWAIPAAIIILFVMFYLSGFLRGADAGHLLEDVSAMTRDTEQVGRWRYFYTQFNVLVIYLRLLICPVNQNLDYLYYFKKSFFDGYTPLAFAFLVSMVVFAVWKRRKYPVVTFAIFWYFITLSVESSIIPIRDALFEHRLYLPMFGFAVFAAWLIFQVFSRKRSWVIAVSIVIIASLGTATYLRNRVWHDHITLWSDVVAKAPHNFYAYHNLGRAYASKDQDDLAVRCYKKAISIQPKAQKPRFQLGVILSKRGDVEEAIKYLSEYVQAVPEHVKAYIILGITLAKKGDYDAAYSQFEEAIKINPRYSSAFYNWGVVLELDGRIDEAVRRYKRALKIDPRYANAHYRLGLLLYRTGNYADAVDHLEEAMRLDPRLKADASEYIARARKTMTE